MVVDHFPIPPQFYGIPSLSLFAHVLHIMLLRNNSKLIYFESLLINLYQAVPANSNYYRDHTPN